MRDYLRRYDLQFETHWITNDIDIIKSSINNNHPLIVSYDLPGLGHIAVIKGYTEDNRLIMNDPYTDTYTYGPIDSSRSYTQSELERGLQYVNNYSQKGENAIYPISWDWRPKYFLEIKDE